MRMNDRSERKMIIQISGIFKLKRSVHARSHGGEIIPNMKWVVEGMVGGHLHHMLLIANHGLLIILFHNLLPSPHLMSSQSLGRAHRRRKLPSLQPHQSNDGEFIIISAPWMDGISFDRIPHLLTPWFGLTTRSQDLSVSDLEQRWLHQSYFIKRTCAYMYCEGEDLFKILTLTPMPRLHFLRLHHSYSPQAYQSFPRGASLHPQAKRRQEQIFPSEQVQLTMPLVSTQSKRYRLR